MSPFVAKPCLLACVLLLAGAQAHAQVWRCKSGDSVEFSDVPCPSVGEQLDSRKLKGNSVSAERAPVTKPEQPELGDRARVDPTRPARTANVCPDDKDIRDMETKAGSISLGAKEKAFIADEVRRARQCRNGQGHYTAGDWRLSREAQDAQSSIAGGSAARARAEGMHSAADPVEGDRIAREHAREESDRQIAEAIRQRQARDAFESRVSACDKRGCWARGDYYQRAPDGSFVGPRGSCRLVGSSLQCP